MSGEGERDNAKHERECQRVRCASMTEGIRVRNSKSERHHVDVRQDRCNNACAEYSRCEDARP
jgi:hypothetical protein